MAKLSKNILSQLAEFDTSDILDAVEEIDQIRYMLNDDEETNAPAQLREDLMKLHQLAMNAWNTGAGDPKELFGLAFELEDQLEEIVEHAQKALATVAEFTKLAGK
jgi:hypothetical protein